MAFDGDGIFFVTDSGNQRVVGALGEPFRENLLVRPFGIAANTVTGDIYVTGADSSTLLRFRSNGDLVGTFGSFGSGIEQFRSPLGVAVDDAGATPTNRVFVADTGNSRIQRLSASGFFAARFGREGSAVGEFRNPEGIAINRNGNVVVADTGNHRIQVLNQTGEMILAFGSQGSGNGQFNRPVAVALDDDDNIHVVDQGNNRVQRFSSDGQFLEAFGQPGSGIGQFNAPTGITIATDALIAVADTGNHRVQGFFTPEPPNDNLSIETRSSLLQPSASGSGKRKPNDRDSSRQGRTRGDGPSNR
jgi:DNA-binding beta-propeller fold protein YncE